MSIARAEAGGANVPDTREFMRDFETTRECYRLVDGVVGGRGETEDVQIAAYHAPVADLLDDPKFREHCVASEAAPARWMPLEIGDKFRYGFDASDTSFSIGVGAFLHTPSRRVPVRVVRVQYPGFSTFWLYRDEHDQE